MKCLSRIKLRDDELSDQSVQFFLRSTNLQVIVFDLHGTLTCRTSIHPYHIKYRNEYIRSKVGDINDLSLQEGTDETFALFPMLNKYEFYETRDHDPEFRFDAIHIPDLEIAKTLKKLGKRFHTVLHSDSSQTQILRTLDAMMLDHPFNLILGVEHGTHKILARTKLWPVLCEKFQVETENIVVVGDRYDKDVLPILEAGGNAILVKSHRELSLALERLQQMELSGFLNS